MGTITLVKSDDGDWEGLYFNSRLATEGHSVSVEDVLEIVHNYPVDNTEVVLVNHQWMDCEGNLPIHLYDIPQEAIIKC